MVWTQNVLYLDSSSLRQRQVSSKPKNMLRPVPTYWVATSGKRVSPSRSLASAFSVGCTARTSAASFTLYLEEVQKMGVSRAQIFWFSTSSLLKLKIGWFLPADVSTGLMRSVSG